MNSSPVLLISFGNEDSASLKTLATACGLTNTQMVTGPVSESIRVLSSFGGSPETIIIDIGPRGKDVLADLDELALYCEAGVSVLIIGSVNDIGFYRELKQRGIVEYFPRPAQVEDIKNALQQAEYARQQQRASLSAHGTVITCMSTASGDGGSTLAVNLSYCLAEAQKQSTVLVDMDYQFGLIAKSLDVTAPFGIKELFDNPDRGIDDILIEKMLARYGDHLRIIASPNELQMLPQVPPETIKDLIDILRARFKFVVIDVPNIWTPWTAATLKFADHNILVSQLWLRSLTHTTRLLNACQAAGISRDHISLVINRSGAKFKEALSAEEFERICHHKIEAYLANDIKALVTADNQGKTVYETATGNSLLPQQFKQISLALMERFNVQGATEAAPETQNKRGLMGIFDKKAGG